MGLFDNPFRSLDLAREAADKYMPEHDVLARKVAQRSIVMLKNEDSILPLKTAGQKIAVVGWWVDDKQNEEGCGVVWGNSSFVTTLADGISNAMVHPSTEFTKVQANTAESVLDGGVDAATKAAGWADVVVLAVGEPTNYSSEAQSRTDIVIPDAQMQVAKAVIAVGKPVVVLLKNGRAIALDDALLSCSSILVTWFLGKMSGDAIGDILFGEVSPSGRLPVSFPIRSGQQPYFYNHMSSGRPCTPGARSFKNCWREIPNNALYPFGFGLTYSQFE